jgi:putative ABC transport system permease protein
MITEGATIGLLSWLLAALAAWPLSRLLGNVLVKKVFTSGLDFRFDVSGLLIWLAVSTLMSAFACFLPARRASRTTIREALSHE